MRHPHWLLGTCFLGIFMLAECSPVQAQTQSLFGGSSSSQSRGNTGRTAGSTGSSTGLNLEAGTGSVNTSFGTGFVGRSDNSGRFVGDERIGTQQGGATGQNRQFQNLNRQLQNSTRSGRRTTASTKTSFQPQLRVAIPIDSKRLATTRATTQTRIGKIIGQKPKYQDVHLAIDDQGQATIAGTVSSEADMRLIEQLVRLEPSISLIKNDLVVASTK